jgi:Fe-S cluster assembly protein SufD
MSVNTLLPESIRAVNENLSAEWNQLKPKNLKNTEALNASRELAWQQFVKTQTPSVKNENWRYSNPNRLDLQGLTLSPTPTKEQESYCLENSALGFEPIAKVIFLNDQLLLKDIQKLPKGVSLLSLNEAIQQHPELIKQHLLELSADELGSGKWQWLMRSHLNAGLCLVVEKNTVVEEAIEIFYWSTQGLTTASTLVITEENAQVHVVEHLLSVDSTSEHCTLAMSRLVAAKNSRIDYCLHQSINLKSRVFLHNTIAAEQDANIHATQIQLGADFIRSESVSSLNGKGAHATMLSLSLPVGEQVVDQRTLQLHHAKHTSSDLLYKNALFDQSKNIFSGLIQVFEGAHFTDAYQTCRNLLNSEEAEVNSMPGLEINADQVKCSHGSTSSPLAKDDLFYLQSRGLRDNEARKLLVLGFLQQVVDKIPLENVRQFLTQAVEDKFDQHGF